MMKDQNIAMDAAIKSLYESAAFSLENVALAVREALAKRAVAQGEPMTAKIIPFTGITKLDLSPDVVLENLKGKLEGFVIVGFTPEGEEYFSSTYADGGTALWLMERCKKQLLEG